MKRAIRYLRFSQKGQSNGSIERQELYTDQWLCNNHVMLVDTFKDEGSSARTFDRPDFKKLQSLVAKHHKSVDYLLVDQLDRFSRNAGEAIAYVKMLQRKYGIQVVSVTEGIIFDYETPGSFFRTGLQLLLAEEDNINRSIKVKGGIYTAKAKEGRYIYRRAPFGYRINGEKKERHLVVKENEAAIVKFIYDQFLKKTPLYIIKNKARELGFVTKGNVAVEKVLTNPVYAGLLKVEQFKEYPGGLYLGIHEPIIDVNLWNLVQQKMKKTPKIRTKIDENIPLRGIVKCHCGVPLTGAPSRSKSGKYFYYYKCKHSGHNNISAKKAHAQLLEILKLIYLSDIKIQNIAKKCRSSLKSELDTYHRKAVQYNIELEDATRKLYAIEEKYIADEIGQETYERWFATYNLRIEELKKLVVQLNKDQNQAFKILNTKLEAIKDLQKIFIMANTLQKRHLINLIFTENLYYQDNMFKTPTILQTLSYNHSALEDKQLMIVKAPTI